MHKRIRVLCTIGSMNVGGAERQIVGLLNHLDRERFSPILYTIYRQGPLLDEVPEDVPVFSFADGYEPPKCYWPGRLRRAQIRHLADTIRQQQVDLVYDQAFLATLITGPAARRTNTPQICTIVNNPEDDLRTAGRFAQIKKRLLRSAYRNANRVVAVSDDLRDKSIAFYGLPTDQVVVVPNWIDIERIDRMANVDPPPFKPDRFHVVVACRLAYQKGQLFLIKAVQELAVRRGLKNLLVHLLGEGPDELTLRKYVTEHDLDEFVRFEGLQVNPLPYIRAAQLFCLPSLFEGMPNVLLEAMACRTPALASDCPTGPREALDGGRLGRLVPPGNVPALVDALEDAVLNYDNWLACVEDARRYVEEAYGPKRGLSGLEPLFLDATGTKDIA